MTFNALISACDVGQQWERPMVLLRELRRVGLAQDAGAYSVLLSAFEGTALGEHDGALLGDACFPPAATHSHVQLGAPGM